MDDETVVRTHSSWLWLITVFAGAYLKVTEHHRAGLDQAAITFRDETFASATRERENTIEKIAQIHGKVLNDFQN